MLEGANPATLPEPLRILVAEDNYVNQIVVDGMLQRDGHHVTLVVNGREAVEALKTSIFDLVLMDRRFRVVAKERKKGSGREQRGECVDADHAEHEGIVVPKDLVERRPQKGRRTSRSSK